MHAEASTAIFFDLADLDYLNKIIKKKSHWDDPSPIRPKDCAEDNNNADYEDLPVISVDNEPTGPSKVDWRKSAKRYLSRFAEKTT